MPLHYGKPLEVVVENGTLRIEIGIDVLAYAVAFSEWANPYDEAKRDYIRTFAIADPLEFARDVKHAMLSEREDGSSSLSDFLDKASESAVNDGSLGLADGDETISHGKFSPIETWVDETPRKDQA